MATFFIRRLREAQQEKLRWAPQQSTPSALPLKPIDYRDDGSIEAGSTYEAWQVLRQSRQGLRVGDVLVEETGRTWICRYSGFEAAEWILADMAQQVIGQQALVQGDQTHER